MPGAVQRVAVTYPVLESAVATSVADRVVELVEFRAGAGEAVALTGLGVVARPAVPAGAAILNPVSVSAHPVPLRGW